MQNSSDQIVTLFTSLMPVISWICTWKIFADRGEPGWKALIPFYSCLIFSRLAGDEKKGRYRMISCIVMVIMAIVFLISLNSVISEDYVPGSLPGILLWISGIAGTIAFVSYSVFTILLKVEFVKQEKDEGYVAVLWSLCPIAGDLYYAFFKQ